MSKFERTDDDRKADARLAIGDVVTHARLRGRWRVFHILREEGGPARPFVCRVGEEGVLDSEKFSDLDGCAGTLAKMDERLMYPEPKEET